MLRLLNMVFMQCEIEKRNISVTLLLKVNQSLKIIKERESFSFWIKIVKYIAQITKMQLEVIS